MTLETGQPPAEAAKPAMLPDSWLARRQRIGGDTTSRSLADVRLLLLFIITIITPWNFLAAIVAWSGTGGSCIDALALPVRRCSFALALAELATVRERLAFNVVNGSRARL